MSIKVADIKEVTFEFVDGLCGREISYGIPNKGDIRILLPEVSDDAQVVRDLMKKLFGKMNQAMRGGGFGGPAGIKE